MSDALPHDPIQLGDVTFSPHKRLIAWQAGECLLDRRSSDVLLALATNYGGCVSKEELLRAAWPGQIVHENSLAKTISRLRQALTGSGLEIVATYGLGYTLRSQAASTDDDVPVEAERPSRPTQGRGAPWAIAAVAALAVLGGATWLIGERLFHGEPSRKTLVLHDAPNVIATILWVDDHPSNNQAEVALFRKRGIAVHLTTSTDDALKLLAMNRYALVISDLGRGEDRLAGIKLVQSLRQRHATAPVIIYTVRPPTAAGQEAQRQMVTRAGANGLAVTPAEIRQQVLERFNSLA